MITLPTLKSLEQKRDKLYARLNAIVDTAPINIIEDIARQISAVNRTLNKIKKKKDATTEKETIAKTGED